MPPEGASSADPGTLTTATTVNFMLRILGAQFAQTLGHAATSDRWYWVLREP